MEPRFKRRRFPGLGSLLRVTLGQLLSSVTGGPSSGGTPRLPVQCRYDLLCLEQPLLQGCERFVFAVVDLAVEVVHGDILEGVVDGSPLKLIMCPFLLLGDQAGHILGNRVLEPHPPASDDIGRGLMDR